MLDVLTLNIHVIEWEKVSIINLKIDEKSEFNV